MSSPRVPPPLTKHQKRILKTKVPDPDWTPFRAEEKKYKSRIPPPDVTDVLDFASPTANVPGGWRGRTDAFEYTTCNVGNPIAYSLTSIPGLVILPGFLSPDRQRDLVHWSLYDHARDPNPTNLDVHYAIPTDIGLFRLSSSLIIQPLAADNVPPAASTQSGPRQLIENTPASLETYETISATPKPPDPPSHTVPPLPVSSLIPKLRWANIGWFYHWGSKQYDFTKGKAPIDDSVRQICKNAVAAIDWGAVFTGKVADEKWPMGQPDWESWRETYEPDAGIVNFYQTKDTLMGHVDRSEVCATSPLVSISLGHAAIFLIGGPTRDSKPTPILLRSGDVVVMAGPVCRRAYHGVPRILESTLPSHFDYDGAPEGSDEEKIAEYMRNTRININVRQVFPKGFVPC